MPKEGEENGLTLDEVKAFLDAQKDSDEVKAFLAGLNPLSGLTAENVAKFIEGNPLLKGHRDSFTTKSIETWQEKNLERIYSERYAKEHPEETEEQKRIKALEIKNAENERRATRADLRSKALQSLTEKGFKGATLGLVDHLIGENEEATVANIERLTTAVTERETELTEKLNKGFLEKYGREIDADQGGPAGAGDEEKLSDDESMASYHRKLQEQGQL